ncbi:MAG: ubiquinol-cytochrome c reductase iron-sulfur subunit [Arenicellales bacterium]|nr:ubiquinol-cytochrome c reductase iron-sulfur subunit [Arenicellales bacterium]
MIDDRVDKGRRRFLTAVTSGVGVVGGAFAATPFVLSMTPSERAKAAGAPVEIDISKLQPGQMLKEIWRGNPVWVISRTPQMLESLKTVEGELQDPASEKSVQPDYAKNEYRSKKPEILVLVGICTHLGCSPVQKFAVGPDSGISDDWPGGFFCPCHGSKFDLAGRVYSNVPAPTNMVVPPYKFVNDTLLLIGVEEEAA